MIYIIILQCVQVYRLAHIEKTKLKPQITTELLLTKDEKSN